VALDLADKVPSVFAILYLWDLAYGCRSFNLGNRVQPSTFGPDALDERLVHVPLHINHRDVTTVLMSGHAYAGVQCNFGIWPHSFVHFVEPGEGGGVGHVRNLT
jgi:hypothetical protein